LKSMPEVLIVGAGPTGLVLALWLTRLGVRVRIIDKAAEPAMSSRALAVQARTLELYAQMGLADAVLERGRRALAANVWVTGRRVAHAALGNMGEGLSPYPFALIYPQDEHERFLISHLREAGVDVERRTELAIGPQSLRSSEQDGSIVVRLRRPDGSEETCEIAYLAGCDGARSAVREGLGVGFSGGTYEHLFYVADVEATGAAANGEINVGFDRSEFLAVFPLRDPGRIRLVGTIRDDPGGRRETLEWADVNQQVISWMQIEVARVNWFSTYRVHHRVASRFRHGRAFLLGDAAHVHSPVGGQGMNTGIGDAVNLSWKLAAVLHRQADAAILDSYETERIAFARRLVATTDQAFTAVTSSTPIARAIRLHLVPLVVPAFFAFRVARRFAFRTVSQILINYRGSMLSEGRAGEVHGGDRLPWVRVSPDSASTSSGRRDTDNFASLKSLDWQVHVYGDASPEIAATCEQRGLPLRAFGWSAAMEAAGLQRNALYLIRPDGYVALAAEPQSDSTALASYLDARNIQIRPH
ncbi:MAG TPA: FAD-dependent monooxygenase, partial [Vicinamibacterales bacterium]|nr:FAD-dependent monooxygenase [Vicinamibacterales bacterium]